MDKEIQTHQNSKHSEDSISIDDELRNRPKRDWTKSDLSASESLKRS
jgi:hypothetical protein